MSAASAVSNFTHTASLDCAPRIDSIIYSAFAHEQMKGSQPFTARRIIRTIADRDLAAVLPEGFAITRRLVDSNTDLVLAAGDSASALIERYLGTRLVIFASATEVESARRFANDIRRKGPGRSIPATTWSTFPSGTSSASRRRRQESIWIQVRVNPDYPRGKRRRDAGRL